MGPFRLIKFLPSWHNTLSSFRLARGGKVMVKIYTVPLFVPAHSMGVECCTGKKKINESRDMTMFETNCTNLGITTKK